MKKEEEDEIEKDKEGANEVMPEAAASKKPEPTFSIDDDESDED